MTCTGDYCKQKTRCIYFGRSLEETRSFHCLFYTASCNALTDGLCVQAVLISLPPSLTASFPDR